VNLHNIPREQTIPHPVYEAMWGLYKELGLRRFRYYPNMALSLFVEEQIYPNLRPAWTHLTNNYWTQRGRRILEEDGDSLDKTVFDIEIVSTEEAARRS
jgi:hypothetical protein